MNTHQDKPASTKKKEDRKGLRRTPCQWTKNSNTGQCGPSIQIDACVSFEEQSISGLFSQRTHHFEIVEGLGSCPIPPTLYGGPQSTSQAKVTSLQLRFTRAHWQLDAGLPCITRMHPPGNSRSLEVTLRIVYRPTKRLPSLRGSAIRGCRRHVTPRCCLIEDVLWVFRTVGVSPTHRWYEWCHLGWKSVCEELITC